MDPEQGHGSVEELTIEPVQRPLRPLTAVEKLAATNVDVNPLDSASTREVEEDVHSEIAGRSGVFAKLQRTEGVLERRIGIESKAILRKLPEEPKQLSWVAQLNMALLWASASMNISSLAGGVIGWELGLDFKQSILICVFGSLLGSAVTAFCATLGAATGLRQMSVSRYSLGWYPNKLVTALNIVQQLFWAAAGCISGGLALTAVSNGHLSVTVGIVIIALVGLITSFFGLRAILMYGRYAWLPCFIVFIVILSETGQYASSSRRSTVDGTTLSGQLLTFLAMAYGLSAAWATVASDYYVQYPANVSRVKVFMVTWLGLAVPTSLGMIAGSVLGSGFSAQADWHAIYRDRGLSSAIEAALYPHRFASFLVVMLGLSSINMNTLHMYSAALSCQQLARPLAQIPRFVWAITCFIVILALSLGGRTELFPFLQDFLSLLGCWCTAYFVVLFTEHFYFRKGKMHNYDLEGWNDARSLPAGFAAGTSFALGIVAWVMGMARSWYVGPLAAFIGKEGGDIANEFALVLTLVAFVPLRHLELRYLGK